MKIAIQFRDLNIDWNPEGVCALVGSNGCGKTSLLEALNHAAVKPLDAHSTLPELHIHTSDRILKERDRWKANEVTGDPEKAFPGQPPLSDGGAYRRMVMETVQCAKKGSLIAFDDFGHNLHPHAVRALISHIREAADDKDLTIILATHSETVLNNFCEEPSQVYVMSRGQVESLTDLHTEEYLAQARLGTLYSRLAFGSPI